MQLTALELIRLDNISGTRPPRQQKRVIRNGNTKCLHACNIYTMDGTRTHVLLSEDGKSLSMQNGELPGLTHKQAEVM